MLNDFLVNNGYGYESSEYHVAKSMASKYEWDTAFLIGRIGLDQYRNNRSGFSGFPAGYRNGSGLFSHIGIEGKWWTSSEIVTTYPTTYPFYRSLKYDVPIVAKSPSVRVSGYSIRCLRD